MISSTYRSTPIIYRAFCYSYRPFSKKVAARLTEHDDVIKSAAHRGPAPKSCIGPAPAMAGPVQYKLKLSSDAYQTGTTTAHDSNVTIDRIHQTH